jgi:hypothetical protein
LALAGVASAGFTRPNTFSFGSDGLATSDFGTTGPQALNNLGYDQSAKRLYVTHQNPNGIYGYDVSVPGTYTPLVGFAPLATSSPSSLPGIGFNETSGNVYMSSESSNLLYGFSSTGAALGGAFPIDPAANPGAPLGSPKDICGAAVDSAGNLWVSNWAQSKVLEYSSSGVFLGSVDTTAQGRMCQVAFDASDNLYTVYSDAVWKYTAPSYTSATKIDNDSGVAYLAVDKSTNHLFVARSNVVKEYDSAGALLIEFGKGITNVEYRGVAVNQATNDVYVSDNAFSGAKRVRVFGSPAIVPDVTTGSASAIARTAATVAGHVDLAGGPNVTECKVEYGLTTGYGSSAPCSPTASGGTPYTGPQDITANLTGMTAGKTYHYKVIATNVNGSSGGADRTLETSTPVTDIHTDDATAVTLTSATLHGSFSSESIPTNFYFEYGTTTSYGTNTASPPGPPAVGDSASAPISGLSGGTTYHYRLVATNSFGTTIGPDHALYTSQPPEVSDTMSATDVKSDSALIHLKLSPNGLDTTYHVDYGPEDCGASACVASESKLQFAAVGFKSLTLGLTGLEAGAVYHYRVFAENSRGSTVSSVDHYFRTFPTPVFSESCPNALARQQTGSAFLLDCRAYELVSAADAGGYSVESDLLPGQAPFDAHPDASGPSQVIYGVHNGGIPGIGNPTNKGIDPYVATRSEQGWSTEYVGIPADGTPSLGPFASSLLAADSSLGVFAFGGPEICDPCFGDGSTGIPLRLADGSLIQGMAGSQPVALPVSSGTVMKPFSANGEHFIFGSDQAFEPEGNPETGDATIYDRNLATGVTQVVSTMPDSSTIEAGEGLAELDVSEDGSRIVVATLVGEDGEGNRLWHPYMHVGGSAASVDLAPGTTTGVVYAGMAKDGSRVFLTSRDKLTGDDTDTSVDLFEADVSPGGALSMRRVSTGDGGTGDTDFCDPAGNSYNPESWNSIPGGESDCSIVAIGGGGGVASGSGTVYFLSPELLDGPENGVDGAPNLFVAAPEEEPRYVATLESGASTPLPPGAHGFVRASGPFNGPGAAAFDPVDGSYYVLDNLKTTTETPGAFVRKYKANGSIDTTFGTSGVITGSGTPGGGFRENGQGLGIPAGIAVDTDPGSPSYRDLYVPDFGNSAVYKFSPSGTYISQIDLSEEEDQPTGVAVNPSNGNVYIATFYGDGYVFSPEGAPTGSEFFSGLPLFKTLSIAVDSNGYIYLTDKSRTRKYNPSGTSPTTFDANASFGVAVDRKNDHVYVDEGNQIVEYTPGGSIVSTTGQGALSTASGLGADSNKIVVANGGGENAVVFGPIAVAPSPGYDHPLVIDSVKANAVRHLDEFQVNSSGDDAIFTSTLELASYDPGVHNEIYRFDLPEQGLRCVSCANTNAEATGDATIPAHGLGVIEGGRVFFTTTEPLVLRDTDAKKDAYEWKEGDQQLISTGASPFDSGVLSASADGTDVYFFTRDTLAKEDRNGAEMKIYDAREGGGFFVTPQSPQCAASDECHGPGSKATPDPPISSIAGSPEPPIECEKGDVMRGSRCAHTSCPKNKVRRSGKCVRRHTHKRKHHGNTRRRRKHQVKRRDR